MRAWAVAVAVAGTLAVVPAASAGDLATPPVKDYAKTALNIFPSGQYGAIPPPPGADDQALMYDGLTPLFDDVSRSDLDQYFKSERFGISTAGPGTTEPVPRPGVTIVRDSYDVPHVTATTHDGGRVGGRLDRGRGPGAPPQPGALQRSRGGHRRAGP
jgi:hypothetical protein